MEGQTWPKAAFKGAASAKVITNGGQAIYGPHIYTDVFEDGWASEDTEAVWASVARAADEARFHDAHLFVGEFGHDPRTARGQLYQTTCFEAFDAHQASWALWLYEEHSQDAWGLWDEGAEAHSRGALRDTAADLVARAYPTATAGRLTRLQWDPTTRTLTLGLEQTTGEPHELAVPSRVFAGGVDASCDGEPVAVAGTQPGRVEVVCEGAELVVTPGS